jgi:hypothetical protein
MEIKRKNEERKRHREGDRASLKAKKIEIKEKRRKNRERDIEQTRRS